MLLWDEFPPDPRVRKEAVALLDAGHEVVLLCDGTDHDRPATETVDGIEVIRLRERTDFTRPAGIADGIRYLATGVHPDWRAALAELLASERVDAIHVHDLPPFRTATAVATETPVVLDMHENWVEAIGQYRAMEPLGEVVTDPESVAQRLCFPQWRTRRWQASAVRSAAHVLAVVDEARERYLDAGSDPDRTTVVSNTVDLTWFDRCLDAHRDSVPDHDGYTFTYVGTLSGPHRGVDVLLRAVPTLVEQVPDARVEIVGDGPRADELRTLAAELGVTDVVEFAGWADPETLPARMAAADVGVVPHRSNPHTETTVPHKLFQYMAAEMPVLVSDVRPLARIVTETESGRVGRADDPDSLADAAVSLATMDDRGAALGRAGRAAVERDYSWAHDAARLVDVYDSLVPGDDTG